MSKETPYTFLNNVLNNLRIATPLLIKFNKTREHHDRTYAMMNGGYNSLLYSGLLDENLLQHIDLNPYFDLCTKIDELAYDDSDETGEMDYKKTLDNFEHILECWSELYNKTLELLLSELEPHKQKLMELEGDQLREYCMSILPYGTNFRPEFIDHFISLVHKHIKKGISQKAA